MSQFSIIKSIATDTSDTWRDKLFITLDIDWAHDDILDYSIDIFEENNIPATWFITHDTPILQRLRRNPIFELGIHPNFNFLLNGDERNGKNINDVVLRLMDIVPEAKSVRSHSMTQSTKILDCFAENGLTHDCNHFIPIQSGINLQPYKTWNGLTKIPYFWEDDIACLYDDLDLEKTLTFDGLKIYDFHPIHVFLNTENLNRHENSRDAHYNIKELINHQNIDGYGSQSFLIDLIKQGI